MVGSSHSSLIGCLCRVCGDVTWWRGERLNFISWNCVFFFMQMPDELIRLLALRLINPTNGGLMTRN